MKNKKFKVLYILFIGVLLVLMACSKDETKGGDPKEETKDPEIENLSICSNISIVEQSLFPIDKITVKGISDDLKNDITAEFWYKGEFTDLAMNVAEDENGESFIIAPIHPILPLEGGELQVVFKNGEGSLVCDPISFTINELPKANGYTKEVALALDVLLTQSTDYLGIDKALFAGDLENLNASYFPFAMIYNLLHNESTDFALLPFIENTDALDSNSVDKETVIDLSDRILKKYDLLDLINGKVDAFEQAVTAKNETLTSIDPIDCENIDEDDLAMQMNQIWDTFNFSLEEKEKIDKLALGASALSIVPKISKAGALAGFAIFAFQKLAEGYQNTRLSQLNKLEFTIDPTNFIEESACDPVTYGNIKVWASTKGWEMDKDLFESLFQIGSLGLSFISVDDATSTVLGAASLFTGEQLNNLKKQGYLDGDRVKIDSIACGPINIVKSEYFYAKISGESFKLDEENTRVYPLKAGTSELEVGLELEAFGGVTISAKKELVIKPVSLNWVPNVEVIKVTPGESIDLEVQLQNALNKELTVTTPEGAIQYIGFADDGVAFGGRQQYRLFTPSVAEIDKYPFTVTAVFDSQECLRGNEDAEPVKTSIIINADVPWYIEVYTLEDDCLAPGDYRQFDVNLSDEDIKVVWSAKHEDNSPANISSTGGFTAPQKLGKYYITATAEENSEVTHTLEIEVKKCTCSWEFSGGGFEHNYEQAWYNINGDMTNGTLQMNLHNDFYNVGDEEMIVNMDISFLPEIGETMTTGGLNDDNLANNLMTITGLHFPDTVVGPIGIYEVTITRENGHIEGSITGILRNTVAETEFPFELEFSASEGLLSCE